MYATGPSLVRWTLHRRAAIAHCEVLDATPHSVRDAATAGSSARRTVSSGPSAPAPRTSTTCSPSTRRSHDFGDGRNPGELVFVADPDRRSTEDGGWLVGFVHDETRHEADFVVLDAQAIERPALADGAHPATASPTARTAPGSRRAAQI